MRKAAIPFITLRETATHRSQIADSSGVDRHSGISRTAAQKKQTLLADYKPVAPDAVAERRLTQLEQIRVAQIGRGRQEPAALMTIAAKRTSEFLAATWTIS